LADELDGLPLALATAGAYLYQVSTTFADYLQSYKASWLRLQRKTPRLLLYEDRALYSTWNISLHHVKQQSELATKLLQLWAYFDNQDVWLELLQECQDDGPAWFLELIEDQLRFDAAMRVLCDHALVEAHTTFRAGSKESRGYGMHSCVHAWTMHVVNEVWDDAMAGLALKCVSFHVPRSDELQYLMTQRRLLRHADRIRDYIDATMARQENDPTIVDALYELGYLYLNQSKLDEAGEMYNRALEGYKMTLGLDHSMTLNTVSDLGTLSVAQGSLGKAEDLYKQALEGQEKALRSNHTSTLSIVNNLGRLYREQGKLDKAEKMYEQALEGRKLALSADHIMTLATVQSLGSVYRSQGRLHEAEEMYQRALQGYEKLGLNDNPMHGIFRNLGILYADQGRLDEAEEMLKRGLEGYEKHFGSNHTICHGVRRDLNVIKDRIASSAVDT
jgi:tetratricopeptide (TPR) repeat protein